MTEADPPPGPGDTRLWLDGRGFVRTFEATPDRWAAEPPDSARGFPDGLVFRETGLDASRFHAVEPMRVPAVPYEVRREWMGSRAEFPELELHLCAATWRGRIAAVTVQGPWEAPDAPSPLESGLQRRIGAPIISILMVVLWGTGFYFVRRNIRLERGDRRGATRVAAAGFLLTGLAQLPGLHLSPDLRGFLFGPLLAVGGSSLIAAAILWLIYMALEPFLRRRVPELLVGWARVLDGRVRDPLVGRQVLIGVTVGAFCAVLYHLVNGLPTWRSFGAQTTIPSFSINFGTLNHMVPLSGPFGAASFAVTRAFAMLMIFFLLRLFISRKPILMAVLALLFTALNLGGENPALETPLAFVEGLVVAWTLVQGGPLTLGVAWFSQALLQICPLRAAPSLWYVPYVIATWALLLGLGWWGFRASLGGRSPFGALNPDA